ncbi:MAG: tyrosine-type recombinase/integrase [Solirubrobacteraceae bacterium]
MPNITTLSLRYIQRRTDLRQIAPATADGYRDILLNFARFVGGDRQVDRISQAKVEAWLAAAKAGAATIRHRITVIDGFYQWCIRMGHARKNPAADIQKPPSPICQPRGVHDRGITRLLDMAPDARARLIICFEVQEGLRSCEVARMQTGDIDFAERVALVRGKGGRERLLPVSDETWDQLEDYLAEHPAPAGPLIRSYHDERSPITAKWVARLVGSWMRQSLIKESGHALRHAMAQTMLRNGASLRDIQLALGHASLQTTQRYLGLASVPDLRKTMGKRRYSRRPSASRKDSVPSA